MTVCRNSERTIRRCIESVINQTYKHVNYIIIDGNSTDYTCNIINEYREHISTFISEPDTGIYSAWNKGIKYATGDYVLIVNSDDTLYDSEVLGNACDFINTNSRPPVIHGKLCTYEERTGYYFVDGYPVSMDKIIYDYGFRCCAAFVRRDIYEQIGVYNENFRIASDLDWIIRLLKNYPHSYQIVFFDRIIANFSVDGISNRQYKLAYKEGANIIKSNFSNLEYVKHLTYIKWITVLKLFLPFCKYIGILDIWRMLKKSVFSEKYAK